MEAEKTDWRGAVGEFFARFSVFKRAEPVRTVSGYRDFLATRPAFVGQKKLFEYVKQRMGMNYPEQFKNDEFIASLNVAKWQVYAACMSDLGIWMAAQVTAHSGEAGEAGEMTAHCFASAVEERFDDPEFDGDGQEFVQAFADRLALTDLHSMIDGDGAFSRSPKELVRWAPIAPQLKKYDVEIVENSIRFAWVAFRTEFNRIAEFDAILADWRDRQAGKAG